MGINERLKEIEARLERATPGPWRAPDYHPHSGFGVTTEAGSWIGEQMSPTDADFIAAARKDVPEMLEALQRIATLNTGNNRELYGVDFEAGMAKALWMVRAAMAQAFHVDMMD